METVTLELQTSKSRSEDSRKPTDSKRALIAEWIVRFAVNADRALTPGEQSVLRSTWEDAFAEIDAVRLKAAFIATMRSHTFKSIPTVGGILQHLTQAGESALLELAEKEWQASVNYSLRLSPDYPDRNPPKISKRTLAAVAAAGGFAHLRDCDRESLVWAGKRFTEAFVRYTELQRQQPLLPEGELKNLLARVAADKAMPALTAGAQ